ncbi:MAG TPA: NUDIX hydrolase [Candidatus Saccharimonadales bacterium]|nr:NUDIX hydrolase [Candidatus Saccharimonadales bacterium]
MEFNNTEKYYGPYAPDLTNLKAVPPETSNPWTLNVELHDGSTLSSAEVARMSLSHPDHGEFGYALSLAGNYPQPYWRNKGGSAIVMWTVMNKMLYIGILHQGRKYQQLFDTVIDLPRGGKVEGETPIQTARRELVEEVGLPVIGEDMTILGVGSQDNTYVLGCPVYFVGVELPFGTLIYGNHGYQIDPAMLDSDLRQQLESQDSTNPDTEVALRQLTRKQEAIQKVEFLTLSDLIVQHNFTPFVMGSMMLHTAIDQLLFHLIRSGRFDYSLS